MKNILVIEDDPSLQDIYKMILEKEGYSVTIFSDGRNVFNNNFSLPDLFLLDKQLSGMDGLEVCKFIKKEPATRHIPVIIISATVGIQPMIIAAGADGFIEKPFDRKHLLEVVAANIQKAIPSTPFAA